MGDRLGCDSRDVGGGPVKKSLANLAPHLNGYGLAVGEGYGYLIYDPKNFDTFPYQVGVTYKLHPSINTEYAGFSVYPVFDTARRDISKYPECKLFYVKYSGVLVRYGCILKVPKVKILYHKRVHFKARGTA